MPSPLLAERTRPAVNLTVVDEETNGHLPAVPTGHNPWSITLSTVKEAIAKYLAEKKLGSEEDGAALLWLRNFGFNNRRSVAEVASLLEYNKNTVWKVLNGDHEAKLDNFVAAVVDFRRTVEATNTRGIPFVETAQSRRIWKLCERALTYQKIVFIYGPSHCGKTTSFLELRKRKPYGRVIHVRMPTGGYISAFKRRLGKALGISGRYSMNDLSDLILEALDENVLLIIDEVTECFRAWRGARVDTLNFVREIYDLVGCGIVLSGTGKAQAGIEGDHRDMFEELRNRGMKPVVLDGKPSSDDLDALAKAVGLSPATGDALKLQNAINEHECLGNWITLLRAGMRRAANKKETMSWQQVILADIHFSKQGKS